MDESRLKRNKHVPSRKGSRQEPNIIEWSYSSRSPPAIQTYIKHIQALEHEKTSSAQRLDLTNVQQLTQRQSGKTRRNLTPSYGGDKNMPFEASLVYADRSRNNSPARKSKSPLSGRITPQAAERSASRPQSRGQELYMKEQSEKQAQLQVQAVLNYKLKHRGASNPQCVFNNESYYTSKSNHNSAVKKENKPEEIMPETVRFNQTKQVWGPNDIGELNISAFLNKRPPSAVNKRDPQVMREKKMNHMPQQLNDPSYVSKIEDSQLVLKDFSKYQSQEELKVGFGLEFQKMGLALKKENLSQKLWRDKSQELKAPPQFYTPANRQYAGLVIENKEVQRPVMEERPLGTEEFYEDFFSTQKMTFEFEKVRVSRRPSSQKDYFTPERTPVYASNNTSKNYFSSRDPQLALSHRPNEGKTVRARYLE